MKNPIPTLGRMTMLLALTYTLGGCEIAYVLAKQHQLHGDGGPYHNEIADTLEHDRADQDAQRAVGMLPRALDAYSDDLDGYRPRANCNFGKCRGGGVHMFFKSYKDGVICFDSVQRFDIYEDFTKKELDRVDSDMRSYKYAVEIIESPKSPELLHRELVPTEHVHALDQVEVMELKHGHRDPLKTDTAVTPLRFLDIRFQVCGAAPPIVDKAQFMTVVVQPGKQGMEINNHDGNPYLLLWQLTDGPKGASATPTAASSGDPEAEKPRAEKPRAEDPPAAQPRKTGDGPATDPPVGAPVQGNLIEVMTAAGKYTKFLQLVEAAGMTDRLKGAGTYTVFAPTDRAFAQEPGYFMKDLMKDKAAITRLVRAHITTTAYPRAALESAHTTDVKTLGSLKEIRSGSGQIKLGGKALHDDQPATNGALWAMDAIMQN